MIDRLLALCSVLRLLCAGGPVAHTLAMPAQADVPAHMVRVLVWQPDQPPAALLVYEPSWGGSAIENSGLARTLTARGYAVAAIDYAAEQPAAFAQAAHRLQTGLDLSSMAAFERTTAEGNWRAVLMASDASQVVRQLPVANDVPIGIFGWSFGGAVALQACQQDSRFAACLNMDGWMFGPSADHPSRQPFMVMSGDPYPTAALPVHDPQSAMEERDSARLRARMEQTRGLYAQLDHATHTDFSGRAAAQGAIPALVGAFFDSALLERSDTPVDAPMPGVRFTRFAAPATGH